MKCAKISTSNTCSTPKGENFQYSTGQVTLKASDLKKKWHTLQYKFTNVNQQIGFVVVLNILRKNPILGESAYFEKQFP